MPGTSADAAAARPAGAVSGESIRDLSHILVAPHDLVAYEYLDAELRWQWGLGTVASLPSARVVQLLLWRSSHDHGDLPPSVMNISPEERKKAEQRLQELLHKTKEVREEHDKLSVTLVRKQAQYEEERNDIVKDVQAAEDTLREARAKIRALDAKDWREIRSYRTPPSIVVLVLEAVMVLLGERAQTWEQIQRIIRRNDFAQQVASFETVKISEATKKRVRTKYTSHPKFTYHDAMNGSQALGYLQRWVIAQVQTSSAQEVLQEYDMAHRTHRDEINGLQDQVSKFQSALAMYEKEGDQLRELLDGKPVKLDGKKSAAPKPRQVAPTPTAVPRASGADAEQINGTELLWRVSDTLIHVLRSAILINYDRALGKEVRLTPEQAEMLKSALEQRAPLREQELQAAEARRKAQEEIEALRADNAELQRKLNEAESARHEQAKDLEDREAELDKLNNFIVDNDIPLLARKTPRGGDRGGATPRRGARRPVGPPVEGKTKEDYEKDIAELEDRLDRALHDNPSEAQLQLLEDDLKATQEELRAAKDALENFREAQSPEHYTSATLKAAEEAAPERQLALALEYIDELEQQLQEKDESLAGAPPKTSDGSPADVRQRFEEIEAELAEQAKQLSDAEERLNDEIHAHDDTKRQLEDLKKENDKLWQKQEDAAREKDEAQQALGDKERELERVKDALDARARDADKLKEDLGKIDQDLQDQARANDQNRESHAADMNWLMDVLGKEAEKQRRQARNTQEVLQDAHAILQGIPMYCGLAGGTPAVAAERAASPAPALPPNPAPKPRASDVGNRKSPAPAPTASPRARGTSGGRKEKVDEPPRATTASAATSGTNGVKKNGSARKAK